MTRHFILPPVGTWFDQCGWEFFCQCTWRPSGPPATTLIRALSCPPISQDGHTCPPRPLGAKGSLPMQGESLLAHPRSPSHTARTQRADYADTDTCDLY